MFYTGKNVWPAIHKCRPGGCKMSSFSIGDNSHVLPGQITESNKKEQNNVNAENILCSLRGINDDDCCTVFCRINAWFLRYTHHHNCSVVSGSFFLQNTDLCYFKEYIFFERGTKKSRNISHSIAKSIFLNKYCIKYMSFHLNKIEFQSNFLIELCSSVVISAGCFSRCF